jgi:hypothetical protein
MSQIDEELDMETIKKLLEKVKFKRFEECNLRYSKKCANIDLKEKFVGKVCKICNNERRKDHEAKKYEEVKLMKKQEKEIKKKLFEEYQIQQEEFKKFQEFQKSQVKKLPDDIKS